MKITKGNQKNGKNVNESLSIKLGSGSECSLSSLAFLSTKYGGQGLAQLEKCESRALGMIILRASVTQIADIMDRP